MQCRHQIKRDYSAQNAYAKISTGPIFHAKVHVLKFSRFLFSRFDRGSRKSRKFGPRKNFPLYGRQKLNYILEREGRGGEIPYSGIEEEIGRNLTTYH